MTDERVMALSKSIAQPWNHGPLKHVIPTASHERFLLKISLEAPAPEAPLLRVDDRRVTGSRTDSTGRCFQFDVTDLQPATEYALQLLDAGGSALTGEWPLKTHPAPDAEVGHLRILAYSCAGGLDGPAFEGQTFWLDMMARRRLLARGLAFQPDVVIANGDHLYWDLRTIEHKPATMLSHFREHWLKRFGTFDRSLPADRGENERILQAILDAQLVELYGSMLRSTPSYFQTDDHDMFENDEFEPYIATVPAGEFGQSAEDAAQRRGYPEFLPAAERPPDLWGSSGHGRAAGVNQFFGAMRYGRLLEVLMYDCRRFADYKHTRARAIPRWTEEWIRSRTLAEGTHHFMHSPSLPFGHSSGRPGDWYPDVIGAEGRMLFDRPKDGWPPGWHAQSQRLVQMLSAQQRRRAVVIEGDYHASAVGQMTRSGDVALDLNPIELVLVGSLGTGDLLFPSATHGVETSSSRTVELTELLPAVEKNGFTIIDVTPEKIAFRLFVWRPPDAVELIETMDPVITYEVLARH